ncbi:MAG: HAD family phosphatase [Verrucomicrobia bacterium]|nr:HAD family phosphatase [Verrucomicrobiota bacterium]MBV9672235.1 HAD family phosphatase [Verrucomicrobiota bacterium]
MSEVEVKFSLCCLFLQKSSFDTVAVHMNLQALVFDFDGLIVDTENPGFISWQELYSRFGATLTLDDWRHATGYVSGFDPGIHLEKLLQTGLDWSRLAPERDARNWELTLCAKTLPGIEPLMSSAKQNQIGIGVASNSEFGWVEGGLQRLGLRGYVDTIVTRDMVINPKPAPDIYLKTVQTLGVSPERAIALEDSEPGSRAAQTAGLKVVAIPNRFSERQDLSFVDLKVASAEELNLARLINLLCCP